MNRKNLIWGLFFILTGTAVILNQTGLLGGVSVWSVIIALLLVPSIVTSVRHLNFWGIFFPLAIIVILFDDTLGIEKLTPWPVLGAALFLSIGFSFICPYRYRFTQNKWSSHSVDNPAWETSSTDGEYVKISTKCSGSIKYITSKTLKGVQIDCKCGGMEVYFDGAEIGGDSAEVIINAVCAGVELYVPKSWNVHIETDCILGAVDESGAKNSEKTGKTLVLKGRTKLSGVDVIYI